MEPKTSAIDSIKWTRQRCRDNKGNEPSQTQTQTQPMSPRTERALLALNQNENINITQEEPFGKLWLQKLIKKSLGGRNKMMVETAQSGRYVSLSGAVFKIGRDVHANFVLSDEFIDKRLVDRLSKVHFEISKDLEHFQSSPVVITDRSKNLTYVNGIPLGTGKSRILCNNDVIAVVMPQFSLFVFREEGPKRSFEAIPKEVSSKYFVEAELGTGAFGAVYRARHITSMQTFALKLIKSEATAMTSASSAVTETSIMRNIEHPCVIRLVDFINGCPSSNTPYTLVLEYMAGGDLLHRVINSPKKYLEEETCRFIFFQLVDALKYLHTKQITHRDIKPDNVLMKDNSEFCLVKLTDFGLSKLVKNGTMLKSLLGTPNYVAPEIIKSRNQTTYDSKCDIWSLGVMLFACLSGTLPFADEYEGSIEDQITTANFQFTISHWRHTSETARRLIRHMLIVDPTRRISLETLQKTTWFSRLLHPTCVRAKQLMNEEAARIQAGTYGDTLDDEILQLHKKLKRM